MDLHYYSVMAVSEIVVVVVVVVAAVVWGRIETDYYCSWDCQEDDWDWLELFQS